MNTNLVEKLTEIGFSDKAASVYMALLEQGSGTADQVAKAAKLNRTTAYVVIKQLMKDGLVSQFKDGKKTKFIAESPRNLDRLLDSQHTEIEHRKAKADAMLPELISLYTSSGERPVVRYFEGLEGLRSLREEILKVKNKEYLAAASLDAMGKIFSTKELLEFSKKREKRNISVKLLYTQNNDSAVPQPVGKQILRQADEKQFPFESDVYIYGDTVAFANTTDRVGGIIITNQSIALTVRSIFLQAWEHAATNK